MLKIISLSTFYRWENWGSVCVKEAGYELRSPSPEFFLRNHSLAIEINRNKWALQANKYIQNLGEEYKSTVSLITLNRMFSTIIQEK